MPDEQSLTAVDVITPTHWYTGQVAHRSRRIADLLADSNTEIFELRRVVASAIGDHSTEVPFDEIWLKKQDVLMLVLEGTHEAPVSRRNHYVSKARYGATLVLPGYIISGILHLGSDAVPARLLTENSTLASFLGMTRVTVNSSVDDRLTGNCEVVLVQRRFIQAVQLTEKPLPTHV
jgi:hypothetical protein